MNQPNPNDSNPDVSRLRGRRLFLRQATIAGAAAAAWSTLSGEGTEAQGALANTHVPNLYRGWNSMQFHGIMDDEEAHVDFLLTALGNLARPKPTFVNLKQPNLASFVAVAKALENTGTGAYLGALPAIFNRDYVAAAGSIAQIEARHSGYLDVLLNLDSTTNLFGQDESFERAFTIDEVLASAGPLVVSLNDGGKFPLTFSTNPNDFGPANDIMILNFALALEFLEKEFYDINVPIFFP